MQERELQGSGDSESRIPVELLKVIAADPFHPSRFVESQGWQKPEVREQPKDVK